MSILRQTVAGYWPITVVTFMKRRTAVQTGLLPTQVVKETGNQQGYSRHHGHQRHEPQPTGERANHPRQAGLLTARHNEDQAATGSVNPRRPGYLPGNHVQPRLVKTQDSGHHQEPSPLHGRSSQRHLSITRDSRNGQRLNPRYDNRNRELSATGNGHLQRPKHLQDNQGKCRQGVVPGRNQHLEPRLRSNANLHHHEFLRPKAQGTTDLNNRLQLKKHHRKAAKEAAGSETGGIQAVVAESEPVAVVPGKVWVKGRVMPGQRR